MRLKYAMVGGAEGSFIGPIHRMAVRMDALADLVAGNFSRDAVRNAESAKALGVERAYDDWKRLIAEERGRIDFLTITTTNETHYAVAREALKAGINVFCEKPLSLTLKEANELGRLAERKGCVLGIPFTYTGYPMVKLARDLVRKGELGRINKVAIEYMQGSFRRPDRRNSWKMDPKIAGPSCVVSDIGVHAFTLVEYVTGLETETLLADLSSYANSAGLDDDASILMRLSDGVKASLITSKIATGEDNGVRLRVYGEKASLHWEQDLPNQLCVKSPGGPDRIYNRKAAGVGALSDAAQRASRFPAGHHEGFVEALANIYDEFTAAVATGRQGDFPGAREGIRSMRFVEAALKSNKSGNRWVKV